jgi:hypothetical protein
MGDFIQGVNDDMIRMALREFMSIHYTKTKGYLIVAKRQKQPPARK